MPKNLIILLIIINLAIPSWMPTKSVTSHVTNISYYYSFN
jgi:hypothetical protein